MKETVQEGIVPAEPVSVEIVQKELASVLHLV
jgi:hypothetical protein